MKVLKTSVVLKALLADGWIVVAIRGSHRQMAWTVLSAPLSVIFE